MILRKLKEAAEAYLGYKVNKAVITTLPDGNTLRSDYNGSTIAATDQVGKAAHPDQSHGHADRHAQQHQGEKRDEPNDGDGIATHLIRPA